MISDELLKAIRTIQEYCFLNDDCSTCGFRRINEYGEYTCKICNDDTSPVYWGIEKEDYE